MFINLSGVVQELHLFRIVTLLLHVLKFWELVLA